MHLLSPGLIAALLFGLVPAVCHATESDRRARLNALLDIDTSGQLERPEVLLGLKNLRTPGGINLPKIKATGKLPEGLLEDKKLLDRYEIFVITQGAPPPYSLTAVDPAEFGISGELRPGPSEEEIRTRRYNPRFDINLRRETKQLFKALSLENSYAQGALFSYSQDYLRARNNLPPKAFWASRTAFLRIRNIAPNRQRPWMEKRWSLNRRARLFCATSKASLPLNLIN